MAVLASAAIASVIGWMTSYREYARAHRIEWKVWFTHAPILCRSLGTASTACAHIHEPSWVVFATHDVGRVGVGAMRLKSHAWLRDVAPERGVAKFLIQIVASSGVVKDCWTGPTKGVLGIDLAVPNATTHQDPAVYKLIAPYWLLTVLLSTVPLVWGARRLRRLVSHRPGACPSCAYNLTGNTSGKCPECGTAIG